MIRVNQLSKAYGSRLAINQISFDVQKGEVVGFLGPNGAGKSTTMKILTGFMPATAGTATVAGYDVFENAIDVKRNIGYLPESPPVYLDMQVRDYLEYTAMLHQVPRAKINAAVARALEKTWLGDVQKRLIGNLSKGFRQRVGLAQAIVHNPAVMILDEPTVGLDPIQIIEIRKLIKELAGEHTVILSTHILPEVTATCHRVIVINKGKIMAEDTLEGLKTKMNHGRGYVMQVKNPKPEVAAMIQKISGVNSVQIQGNQFSIQLAAHHEDAREEIIRTAVEKDCGVLEFTGERITLEEIFLELTTDEAPAIEGDVK